MTATSKRSPIKRAVVIVAAAAVVGVFIVFGGLAAAAALDNKLQWQTRRDEKLLRGTMVSGSSMDALVARRYARATWHTYHVEELYRSMVNCDAIDAVGRRVTLSWEVAHWYTPRPDVKRRSVFITALTPEAAGLTPTFAVPGLALNEYLHGAERSETLYGYASAGPRQ